MHNRPHLVILAGIGLMCWTAMGRAEEVRTWLVRTAAPRQLDRSLARSFSVEVTREYRTIPWAAVRGTESDVVALREAGLIRDYEADGEARLQGWPILVPLVLGAAAVSTGCDQGSSSKDASEQPPQSAPWGIAAIRADEAHSLSTGTGVRVAVIDSGIDADHPDLEVVEGKNFISDQPPGDVEWDDCAGHGTHVAGIIAARDNDIGVVGVAPAAQLYAARVFPCNGGASPWSAVVAAIDWAIQKDVDVINMSLGAPTGVQALEDAVNRAADAGIVVVAAAGNESEPGSPAPVLVPAAYDAVIAVGATDRNDAIASFSNQGPEVEVSAPGVDIYSTYPVKTGSVVSLSTGSTTYEARAMEFSGLGTVEGGLYDCGRATSPADCPASVAGQIALIERGDAFFSEKVLNAQAAGAKGALIYNHTEDGGGLFAGTLGSPGSWPPTVSLSNADGRALQALGNGAKARLQVDVGDYSYLSGTSMATPHVAGVAALLLAQSPDMSVADLRRRLQTSAVDLGAAGKDPVFGYGRVDALAALGGGSQRAAASRHGDSSPAFDSRSSQPRTR